MPKSIDEYLEWADPDTWHPRAPAGMETDENGDVQVREDYETKSTKANYVVSFPNMERRAYSKRPYFVHNWWEDLNVLAKRATGNLLSDRKLQFLEATFSDKGTAVRFVHALTDRFHVPMQHITLVQETLDQTKTAEYGDTVLYKGARGRVTESDGQNKLKIRWDKNPEPTWLAKRAVQCLSSVAVPLYKEAMPPDFTEDFSDAPWAQSEAQLFDYFKSNLDQGLTFKLPEESDRHYGVEGYLMNNRNYRQYFQNKFPPGSEAAEEGGALPPYSSLKEDYVLVDKSQNNASGVDAHDLEDYFMGFLDIFSPDRANTDHESVKKQIAAYFAG